MPTSLGADVHHGRNSSTVDPNPADPSTHQARNVRNDMARNGLLERGRPGYGKDMDVRTDLAETDLQWIAEANQASLESDGIEPLGEHTLLQLKLTDRPENQLHFLLTEADKPVSYAFLEITSGEASGEMFTHPEYRRLGYGRALLARVRAAAGTAGGQQLRLWAHGDFDGASALAKRDGFKRERVLFQLGRTLQGLVTEAPPLPEDVELRAFVRDQDEAELLRVNAAAFVDHPEQGRLSLDDLRQRMDSTWFDPAGLITAWKDGHMVGFHWTKTHPDGNGEVYVLAVDPQAQGMRLGKILTQAGLAHLASRGLESVILYVDESNTKAVQLYRGQGFTQRRVDVQYATQLSH
ncbi:mycothiol synthase [Natronoglycomyces albus]|uniref:Mycothiol acetyltransferase n=1 Tax=Natronoglycomyces albus TaxID=2811108 RepID=A0A895XNR5_9ACTN|nr:mycothiol synthase [Natronoglycomyces albus]QSB05029.1 mycothiol synthase [Natronoglycomyces albus]